MRDEPRPAQFFGNTTNGPVISAPPSNAACPSAGMPISHCGPANSGIGRASNSFLHCFAVHLAHRFDFFRRALSVDIPVPAYICRYNFDRNMKAIRALKLGVQADRFQIAGQL